MARNRKTTVEYFPHYAERGRTISILETLYGNDGYAFWFKLLEMLCNEDRQTLDLSGKLGWMYFLEVTRVNAEKANEIIGTLVELGKIDAQLWNERKIIWVQNFVENLNTLYTRRVSGAPVKPSFAETTQSDAICNNPMQIDAETTQSDAICNNPMQIDAETTQSDAICNNPMQSATIRSNPQQSFFKSRVKDSKDIVVAEARARVREEDFFEEFFSKSANVEKLCMDFHLKPDKLREMAESVKNEWELRDVKHKDYGDYSLHLINQLRIKIGNDKKNENTGFKNQNRHRSLRVTATSPADYDTDF